ncbi:MAG TPA: transcriptional regulator [Armatimonadota bacterium]|jgi:HTH-type transcriptional regulator/antitoxin HigA
MEIRPIRTEEDYQTAMEEIGRLLDAPDGTPEADRLDVLSTLVERYEAIHDPMPPSDPISMVEFVMDQRRLTRRDLEPYLGSRGHVSDILNRRRPLSLKQIRALHQGLGIPLDILAQPYALTGDASDAHEHHLSPVPA